MIDVLPALYPVTSRPSVDHTFFDAHHYSVFRPYLVDVVEDIWTNEPDRRDHTLLRPGTDRFVDRPFEDSVYGQALRVGPVVGTVTSHHIDLDADVGSSWSLTWVIKLRWNVQPTTSSRFYPFLADLGNIPRFGYDEDAGRVIADVFKRQSNGNLTTLQYDLGWAPGQLIVATLTTDSVADATVLYVNGVAQDSEAFAIKAGEARHLEISRLTTQTGVTGDTDLEAYFIHDRALTAGEVGFLHRSFRTGHEAESRWVRMFMALGMATGHVEDLGWRFQEYRDVDSATGGALTRLGLDFKVFRSAGEADDDLRQRIKNRLGQLFSQGVLEDVRTAVADATGIPSGDIEIRNGENDLGEDAHATFTVVLPPGSDALVTTAEDVANATKAAGVRSFVILAGSFAWDVAEEGWDAGAWGG